MAAFWDAAPRNLLEDSHVHSHRRESLDSHIFKILVIYNNIRVLYYIIQMCYIMMIL
jgi:hypothetical protein